MLENYAGYFLDSDDEYEFLSINEDRIQSVELLTADPALGVTVVTHKLRTTQNLIRWLPQNTSRIIGVPGVPTPECLARISDVLGNSHSFYFGDADPESIVIYSALRSLPQLRSLEFYGITERFLVQHRIEVTDWMWCPMGHLETEVERMIRGDSLEEYHRVFGQKFILMLHQGWKLEIEALLHADVELQ